MIPALSPDRAQLWRALQGDLEAWSKWRSAGAPEDVFSRRLLPHAYVSLRSLAPEGLHELRQAHSRALLDFRLLCDRNLPLLRAWREAGVELVLLKGAALALSGLVRPMSDIDVLVRPDDFAQAIRIAGRVGYRPDFAGRAEPGFSHALALSKDRRHEVDLHWTLLFDARWLGLDENLWKRCRQVDFAGLRVQVLAPEDLLLQVCVHAFLAGDHHAWLLDAEHLLSQHLIDWEILWLEAERRRVVPALTSALKFLAENGTKSELPEFSFRPESWLDYRYYRSRLSGPRWLCWILNFLRHCRGGGVSATLGGHARLLAYRCMEVFTRPPGSTSQGGQT